MFAGLQPTRILEVGLGCGMPNGPGESVAVWTAIFPAAHVWMAEYDEDCARKYNATLRNARVHVVLGDQSKDRDLARWALQGPFDFVVDDGSHIHSHIMRTLVRLWPTVAPGGVYFVEDLLASSVSNRYNDTLVHPAIRMGRWAQNVILGQPDTLPGIDTVVCREGGCALMKKSED